MSNPSMFDGLAGLGIGVVVAPWLEWPGPHDMTTLAETVTELAARYRPVVLVGHSTGGVIALSAALRAARGVVAGLVLCDTGANMHGHGDVDAIIETVQAEWGPPLWQAIAARSVHTHLPDQLRDELDRYPAQVSREAVIAALRSQRDTDLTPQLHQLTSLPTLVVHGHHDTARPLAHASTWSGDRRTGLRHPEPAQGRNLRRGLHGRGRGDHPAAARRRRG